ncbi:Glucose-responsive transcription factor, partial [Massospora cicadina]
KPVMRRGKAKDNRACDNCRRRKIRCHAKDNETGCQFCTRMRFHCTYHDPVLKRGPKSSLFRNKQHSATILAQVNEVLSLRAQELCLPPHAVMGTLAFFQRFGPTNPTMPAQAFLNWLASDEPPHHLSLLLHSLSCFNLKDGNSPLIIPLLDYHRKQVIALLHNQPNTSLVSMCRSILNYDKVILPPLNHSSLKTQCHLPPIHTILPPLYWLPPIFKFNLINFVLVYQTFTSINPSIIALVDPNQK